MWNLFNRAIRLTKLFFGFRAASRLNDPEKQLRARQALALQFEDARGLTMKVGQLLASSNDQDDIFSSLVTSISPLPLKTMLPVIEQSLGCSWKKVFISIDESQAAASLGQVHHAILTTGESVAIKVQYPDIQQAIGAEMQLLGLMPQAGPVKQWQFDLDGYRQALKANMDKELDYQHEASQQSFFYQHLCLPQVVIPKVYPQLSSEKMLVQSWEEGDFIDLILGWPQKDREKIARSLLSVLLKSLFQIRLLHGDPHKGNSYFRFAEQGAEMVLMDFGCTIELSEQQSLALLKLIIAVREKMPVSPLAYFVAMGFDQQKLARIEAFLPKLCQYLFMPFIGDKKFIMANWSPGNKMQLLLAEQRWWFRSAGPAPLIFIIRAFQGLVQQLQLLRVDLYWWDVLTEVLPVELIQRAREFEPTNTDSLDTIHHYPISAIADRLKVKVTNGDKILVEAELPAEAVTDIQSFIPAEIQLKLEQSSEIDLQAILARIHASGIAVQKVFDFTDGSKHYQVWLE